MLSGSIDPIDLDIRTIINEELSPVARSSALAAFARATLQEAEQADEALGFKPPHTTKVDGAVGADEGSVRPDGTIEYAFNLLPDIFAWILDNLLAFAPVRSGRFKASFEFYADGVLADVNGPIPQAKEFVFLSSAEYAREIEGDPSRPPESMQAPNGVFEAVATLAQQRFGNQASIRFSYRAPFNGRLLSGKVGNRSDFRTPAITVTLGS